jgi:4'-phosphopantetheinyl transferase
MPVESTIRPLKIWVIPFTGLRPNWREVSSCLSPDELARAERYRFERHKIDFIVARALLRQTLARQLHCDPGAISFTYGEFGKPALTDELPFNLSHCKSHVAIAIGTGDPIGIDVESTDRKLEPLELAKTCFSDVEQSQLATFSTSTQTREAFFRGWTGKEAFIKALGYGLRAPLDKFDVDLSKTDKNALIASRIAGHEVTDWQIRQIGVDSHTFAAVCIASSCDWSRAELFTTEPNC